MINNKYRIHNIFYHPPIFNSLFGISIDFERNKQLHSTLKVHNIFNKFFFNKSAISKIESNFETGKKR